MANQDPNAASGAFDNMSQRSKETNEALGQILDAVSSIADQINQAIEDAVDGINNAKSAADVVGQTMKRGLVSELKQAVKNSEELVKMQVAAEKGQLKASDIAKQRQKIEENKRLTAIKLENLAKNLEGLDEEALKEAQELAIAQQEQLDRQLETLNTIEGINGETKLQKGLTGAIAENITAYADKLDKSGTLSSLLSKNVSAASKATFLMEAGMAALLKGAMDASSAINDIQKNTGIAYTSALKLQTEFALTAANSEKLFVTSKDLNKSFGDLVSQTGLLSDFGGDTLVTMTTLTKQLGLGVTEATQLSLLARIQGKDTESILENTVDTVNAINKQNKTAVSAKQVLNDIATASKSIVVSLGMSPELLAEAATEARGLGLSLAKVDQIAASLLNFESSIENELSFQLLTGKEINLEKARQYALDNDLAGLSQELAANSEITNAFATGNRIQQEAAAAALGLQRDDLADMVYQQELINLSQDEFIEKYGEQAYQQMQAQSAAEKFEAALTKIQGIIGDMGIALSPLIDGFAAVVGFLAESKVTAAALVGIMTALAIVSVITSIATMWKSFSEIPFGIGIPLAIAATAGLLAAIAAGTSKAQSVEDGIADSSRGPFSITDAYGATAITAKGDSLAVSPNVRKGGDDNKMIALLEKIANKDSNVYMDSQKVGTSLAVATSRV